MLTSPAPKQGVRFAGRSARNLVETPINAPAIRFYGNPRAISPFARRSRFRSHPASPPVCCSRGTPAGQVLEAVRNLGLEGVVGKRLDSRYEPGERSGAWIKLRVNLEQEFVIGAFNPGARGFDALLVGVYENKELVFVAKVKNGFVPRVREEIFPSLKALQTTNCPFKNLPEKSSSRWGRP